MERLQVHTERNRDGVRRADAVEFLARETGGAHDGVVVGCGARVGEVGELPCGPARKHLADKPIQALVGDHHRRGAVVAAPTAQRPQGEAIGNLQRVGSQRVQQRLDRPGITAR